jgi:hypothetical protein
VPIAPEDYNQWRAAHREALRLAEALHPWAAVFRRYAGELKYHPQTGIQGHIGSELLDAAAKMRDGLAAVSALAARWDQELIWLRTADPAAPAEELQRDHSAVRGAIAQLRTSLEGFQRFVVEGERASVDAPYGAGAPRRVHPGALCTWVAERAESLARGLANVSLRKENLLVAKGKDLAQR